jgi:hypothetical protein
MFYQRPYIPNREKYNKLCNVCHMTLSFAAVATATAKWHTLLYNSQIAQQCWRPSLSATLYFTYVCEFNFLPLLHFQLQFPKIYTLQTL